MDNKTMGSLHYADYPYLRNRLFRTKSFFESDWFRCYFNYHKSLLLKFTWKQVPLLIIAFHNINRGGSI